MARTLSDLAAWVVAVVLVVSISGCALVEATMSEPEPLGIDAYIGEWTRGDSTPTGMPASLSFHEDGTFDAANFPSRLVCERSENRRPTECEAAETAVSFSGTWVIPDDPYDITVWLYADSVGDQLPIARAHRGSLTSGFSEVALTIDFYVGSLDVPEPSYSFHRPRDAQHFPDLY